MCSVERKKYIAMHIVGDKYLTERDIFKTWRNLIFSGPKELQPRKLRYQKLITEVLPYLSRTSKQFKAYLNLASSKKNAQMTSRKP